MKKLFGILIFTLAFGSNAFAKVPSIISCAERTAVSQAFYTFEFKETQNGLSYVDLYITVKDSSGNESRSVISSLGTHNPGNSDLFNLQDGGFIYYDSSSNQVIFQWAAEGHDVAQIVGSCVLPEPGAGTGN